MVAVEPKHKQSIQLQFGASVQLSDVTVSVAGMERMGLWSPVEVTRVS